MYGEEHFLKQRASMLAGALDEFRSKLLACSDLTLFDLDGAVGEIFPIRDAMRVTFVLSFGDYTSGTKAIIAWFRKDGWTVAVKNTWNGTTSNVRLNLSFSRLLLLFYLDVFCAHLLPSRVCAGRKLCGQARR